MQKDFTINIPDELWVDSWEDNSTASYTYDGPDTLYVRLRDELDIAEVSDTEITAQTHEFVVEVDASKYPDRARLLQETFLGLSREDTFEDVSNPDGSVYKKLTNPYVRDYYEISYSPVSSDTDPELGFQLIPNYKDPKTSLLVEAERRRAYVQKYLDVYELTGDNGTTASSFITAINTSIATLSTAYPWKYIVAPDVSVPKIPAALVEAFANLPVED